MLLFLRTLSRDVQRAKDTSAKGHRYVGAVAADLLGDYGEIEHGAAEAAILSGERQREQPGFHPGVVDLVRIKPLAIEAAKIFGRSEPPHQLSDAVAKKLLLRRILKVHASSRQRADGVSAARCAAIRCRRGPD